MASATRSTGILADNAIRGLFESGRLKSEAALDGDQVQPASLDLRLGAKAFRVRASFLPGPSHLVADKLDRPVFTAFRTWLLQDGQKTRAGTD